MLVSTWEMCSALFGLLESHPVRPLASRQHSWVASRFQIFSDSPREGDFSSSLSHVFPYLAHHTHHPEVLGIQLKYNPSGSLQFTDCKEGVEAEDKLVGAPCSYEPRPRAKS